MSVALGLAAALLGAGCGKKGPPQAPVRILPRPAQNVQVRQVGGDIVVEANLSLSRSDGTPLGPGATVRILRMPPTATLRPGMVSARYLVATFQKEAKLIGALTGSALQQAAPDGHLEFRDTQALTEPGASKGGHFMYGIQVVDERGQKSLMTVPIDIEVTESPAAPVHLTVATAEGEVRLAWAPRDPDRKGELYNVYRRSAAQASEPRVPLNSTPIPEHAYVDKSFQYGETYRYTVRALPSPPPPLRESPPTAAVEVRPLDIYPPKTPTGLAAAEVRHRKDAAHLHPRQPRHREPRRQTDVESAIAVQQRRVVAVQLDALLAGDGDDHGVQTGAQDRAQGERQEQPGKGEQDVHRPHDEHVRLALQVARQQAEQCA